MSENATTIPQAAVAENAFAPLMQMVLRTLPEDASVNDAEGQLLERENLALGPIQLTPYPDLKRIIEQVTPTYKYEINQISIGMNAIHLNGSHNPAKISPFSHGGTLEITIDIGALNVRVIGLPVDWHHHAELLSLSEEQGSTPVILDAINLAKTFPPVEVV